MALKPDREIVLEDISYFAPVITYGGERGGIVVPTGGNPSGAAMDQNVNGCWYIADPSGKNPVGMLMADVVNIDLTRQIINPNKSEQQVGDKVPLIRKGWVVTNFVDYGGTINPMDVAYLAGSGYVTPDSGNGVNRPQVGHFLSAKDEDGYVKLYVDL